MDRPTPLRSPLRLILLVLLVPLGGCVTGAISTRDKALLEGRFSDLEKIAEAQVAQQTEPRTSTLFPLCVSYAKLKRYDKLFPCIDRLEANFAKGDISNVNLDESLNSGFMKGMAAMGMAMMGASADGKIKPGGLGDSRGFAPYMRAEAWLDLGRYKDAASEAQRALDIAKTMGQGERYMTIFSLSALGVAQVHAGRPDDARASAKTLEEVSTFYPYILLKTDKITGLARIYVALGDYERAYHWVSQDDASGWRAFTQLTTAVVLGQSDLFTIQQLPRRFMRAKVEFETGRIDDARKAYDSLLAHPAIADVGEYYWMLLYDRGRIAEHDGQPDKAIELYRRAVEVIEAQRATVGSEASRIGFVGDKQAVYRRLVATLFGAARHAEAFDLVERSKARALVDLLATKKDFAVASGNPDQVRALLAMADSSDALASQVAGSEALLRSRGTARQARDQLRAQAPELADLVTVSSLPLAEVGRQLAAGETLLEYYLDGAQLYGFVLRDGRLTVRRHEANGLAARIMLARRQLADPAADPLPALQALEADLITPFADLLGERLTIVPHGPLHYLAWGALHDGRRYLLERHAIRLLPSASVLPFVNRPRGVQAAGELLAFGNPDLGDAKLDLPAAQAESLRVTKGRDRSRALIRREASETALRRYGGGFRWLHFATHGEFDPSAPLESGLLLAADGQHDGRLTAGELYSLNLDADLVTLSACETGLGKVAGGDDVVGLVRGFLYAGASSIVASLWQVDDAATGEIMARFYQGLAGGDKREALRQAQLAQLKRKPHPFYWAAFQLTGGADRPD